MSSYNSALIANLKSIFILDTLSRMIDLKQVGLYKDKGLIFTPESNDPKTSKIMRKL